MDATGAGCVSPLGPHVFIPQVGVSVQIKHRKLWILFQMSLYRASGQGMLPTQYPNYSIRPQVGGHGLPDPLHHEFRAAQMGFDKGSSMYPYLGNIQVQLQVVIF